MFSPKSIQFLKTAQKKDDAIWFEKHRDVYQAQLKDPFIEVLAAMEKRFKKDLPHFRFSPRSISRPMRTPDRAKEKGVMKDFIACMMGPRKTSRFEMPPCFYLSIGADDIYFGAGLYMPSGPQFRFIRTAIQQEPESLAQIVNQKKFKTLFGGLNPEQMKRPPRGFSVPPKYEPLLMTKSYSVHRKFSAKELTSRNFTDKLIVTAEAAVPLVIWLQQALKHQPKWRRSARDRDLDQRDF